MVSIAESGPESAQRKLRAQFPEKLHFLTEPHRYKILWGGRGGSKSWGIARWLLLEGTQRPIRVLCAREIQNSIADSVHQLLKDQVGPLGLAPKYDVQKNAIVGTNWTLFIFAGLKHNIESIKSLEACTHCWVEEAATVSRESWEKLIPTIRAEGSEIIVSFNPILETDDTYKRFVLNPPPGAIVVKLDYTDNPWFPEVLRVEMEHKRATYPTGFEHIWMGACKSAVEGAIYSEELKKATEEGRLCPVPYDRTKPVSTFWDLGFGDKTAIWFVQAYGGYYNLIDYLENSGKTIEWYVIQLQNRGYMYALDWLPFDAVDTIIHQKLANDKSRSIEMLMRGAGRQVRIAPKLHISDGINAARTLFPQCRFDAVKCADGIQALRHYQWGPVGTSGQEPRAPLHNFASHGADAFRTMATSARQPVRTVQQPYRPPPVPSADAWMG